MGCKVGGCENSILQELEEANLCLDHFLEEVEERARNFDRGLVDGKDRPLRDAALKFSLLTAAKIATIGMRHPPEEQLLRGRLLNAMLLLLDLRDRIESGD